MTLIEDSDNRLHMYNDNECSIEGQITEYLFVQLTTKS